MQALVRAFGVLLMLTALAVTLTQAPDRSVDSLVTRWAPPPSDFMYVNGQFVHFRDEGPKADPVPLVLLHGTAASLHTWQGWVAELRTRRRVITVDLPGAGLTGPFTGQYPHDDYHADQLARFTLDFLDALHVRRFAIGGNALGGEVAWRAAAAAPARVDRLILVDPTGYPADAGRLPVGWQLARAPLINRIGDYLTPRPLVEASLRDIYADPARVGSALVDRYFELLTRDGNRRALAIRLQEAPTDLAPQRLRTLHLPTLILWGAQDRLLPPAGARRFQADIAGSALVILQGLGHAPQEEDPHASVAPVRVFLGLDRGAAPATAPASPDPRSAERSR